MTMQAPHNNPHDQDEALEAPTGLVSALKRLPREPVFIPRAADDAVLRAARKHLNPPQAPKPGWSRIVWWLAGATAVVLGIAVPLLVMKPAPEHSRESAFAPGDLNHDGRVDILDAFALARQLKSGRVQSPQLDLNGDGVVDEHDVAALAARAVRLDPGGHS
jgi:hypothetical protein